MRMAVKMAATRLGPMRADYVRPRLCPVSGAAVGKSAGLGSSEPLRGARHHATDQIGVIEPRLYDMWTKVDGDPPQPTQALDAHTTP